jgi:hypothetical protein
MNDELRDPRELIESLRAEIAKLKAERDAALKKCDYWEEEARRYAQNSDHWREKDDVAYGRGLKRALELMRWSTFYGEGITAILAEIEKAGK